MPCGFRLPFNHFMLILLAWYGCVVVLPIVFFEVAHYNDNSNHNGQQEMKLREVMIRAGTRQISLQVLSLNEGLDAEKEADQKVVQVRFLD